MTFSFFHILFIYSRAFHPNGEPRNVRRAALQVATGVDVPGQVVHLPFVWHEEPKQTKWHPAEASPIIAHMKRRRGS